MNTAPLTNALVRLAVPLAAGIFEFDRTSCLTPDVGPEVETCDRWRVKYRERIYRGCRYVELTDCEVRKAGDVWEADCLSKAEMSRVSDRIEEELADERRPTTWTDADEYDSRRKA